MSYQKLNRNQIAERVAQDIPDGAYVNLGIGLPTKIASYLPSDKDVFLHSENGLLAFGPPPEKGQEDPELINAGKEYVTMLQGGSFFHHGDSFAMMRGGHLDIAVLGAFQVAANGDLANWHTGAPDAIPAIANQLKSQTGLTAQFAVVLAILFWLYLQAQVFLLGAELASVRFHRLWPRSITPQPPLPADHKAYDLYRHRETFTDDKPVGH